MKFVVEYLELNSKPLPILGEVFSQVHREEGRKRVTLGSPNSTPIPHGSALTTLNKLELLVITDHEEGDHGVIIVESLAISKKIVGSYTKSLRNESLAISRKLVGSYMESLLIRSLTRRTKTMKFDVMFCH